MFWVWIFYCFQNTPGRECLQWQVLLNCKAFKTVLWVTDHHLIICGIWQLQVEMFLKQVSKPEKEDGSQTATPEGKAETLSVSSSDSETQRVRKALLPHRVRRWMLRSKSHRLPVQPAQNLEGVAMRGRCRTLQRVAPMSRGQGGQSTAVGGSLSLWIFPIISSQRRRTSAKVNQFPTNWWNELAVDLILPSQVAVLYTTHLFC